MATKKLFSLLDAIFNFQSALPQKLGCFVRITGATALPFGANANFTGITSVSPFGVFNNVAPSLTVS
jgi:hypothetical protein